MPKQPPINGTVLRSEEAKISRSLRIAMMAILISPLDMIFGLSPWIGRCLILLAVLLFIRVFLLDRQMDRRFCSKDGA